MKTNNYLLIFLILSILQSCSTYTSRSPASQLEADPNNENYYIRLGVNKDSTNKEIKKAYRRASQKHHPDKYIGAKLTHNEINDAKVRFQNIQEAYSTLFNENSKALYDLKMNKAHAQSKKQEPSKPKQQQPKKKNTPDDVYTPFKYRKRYKSDSETNYNVQHLVMESTYERKLKEEGNTRFSALRKSIKKWEIQTFHGYHERSAVNDFIMDKLISFNIEEIHVDELIHFLMYLNWDSDIDLILELAPLQKLSERQTTNLLFSYLSANTKSVSRVRDTGYKVDIRADKLLRIEDFIKSIEDANPNLTKLKLLENLLESIVDQGIEANSERSVQVTHATYILLDAIENQGVVDLLARVFKRSKGHYSFKRVIEEMIEKRVKNNPSLTNPLSLKSKVKSCFSYIHSFFD